VPRSRDSDRHGRLEGFTPVRSRLASAAVARLYKRRAQDTQVVWHPETGMEAGSDRCRVDGTRYRGNYRMVVWK